MTAVALIFADQGKQKFKTSIDYRGL